MINRIIKAVMNFRKTGVSSSKNIIAISCYAYIHLVFY